MPCAAPPDEPQEHPADRAVDGGRAAAIKAGTRARHARLDARVMALRPFDAPERYARLVLAQHGFHAALAACYRAPALAALLPGLALRCRLRALELDLADLGLAPPETAEAQAPPCRGEALGRLYVAEGSKLGAGILGRHAARLGFGPAFGARHLAATPGGRGRDWRVFTAALDSVALEGQEDVSALRGAREAFADFEARLEAAFRSL